VGYSDLAPPARNDWVAEANALIRTMAREEDAFVVDLHAAFTRREPLLPVRRPRAPEPGRPRADRTAFFEAITRPRTRAVGFVLLRKAGA
jgi:hypothetical protein